RDDLQGPPHDRPSRGPQGLLSVGGLVAIAAWFACPPEPILGRDPDAGGLECTSFPGSATRRMLCGLVPDQVCNEVPCQMPRVPPPDLPAHRDSARCRSARAQDPVVSEWPGENEPVHSASSLVTTR